MTDPLRDALAEAYASLLIRSDINPTDVDANADAILAHPAVIAAVDSGLMDAYRSGRAAAALDESGSAEGLRCDFDCDACRAEPDESDPIETFSHPFRPPVAIDGHLFTHTSDCPWPSLAATPSPTVPQGCHRRRPMTDPLREALAQVLESHRDADDKYMYLVDKPDYHLANAFEFADAILAHPAVIAAVDAMLIRGPIR